MNNLDLLCQNSVEPAVEIGAYEELWSSGKHTFKSLSELLATGLESLPSFYVGRETALARYKQVREIFDKKFSHSASAVFFGTADYPASLLDARHPVHVLYYRGELDLLYSKKRVAVVGSRNASEDGVRRTVKLCKSLVNDGAVIFSGLAKGIDTAAHKTAIGMGGETVAVIGTPITSHYPPENKQLQEYIAEKHLLVSQVPVIRYGLQSPRTNRFFFPERNVTMSALSEATIIVEAGETSGSLTQARAALAQGRKLFILESCFHQGLSWPERFLSLGAKRVSDYEEIRQELWP